MSTADAVDLAGVRWRVRRRWYPWRRALSLRDLLSATPGGQEAAAASDAEAEDSALPRNVVLKVFFVVLAAVVWLGFGMAKVVFYAVVVVLFLVGSLAELILEIVVMPAALLLRLLGQRRWPVEIYRAGEHFGTQQAVDFAAAGELRDDLLAGIRRGDVPAEQRAPGQSASPG